MSDQKTPASEKQSCEINSILQPRAARLPHHWLTKPAVRIPVLVLLFAGAAFLEAFQVSALSDTDIWWHLRTGLWMLQNHAAPHSGLFSQHGYLPWIASSWGYDVLLAGVYQLLGLRALPVMFMGFRVALALVAFLLAGGCRGNFWAAVLVSGVAQYVCLGLPPLPIFFSVLFFGVELVLLLESQRSASARPLIGLPLLFLLWANLHVGFVLGLGLLILLLLMEVNFQAAGTLRDGQGRLRGNVSAEVLALALVSSALACLITPYGIHLFGDVFKEAYNKTIFMYSPGMHPMRFRGPRDYVLSLLVMAAFLALGRKRSWDLTKLSVMVAATLVAFRIARDGWCAVLLAVAIIGDELCAGLSRAQTLGGKSAPQSTVQWFGKHDRGERRGSDLEVGRNFKLLTAVLVVVVLLAAAIRLPRSDELMATLEKKFPVRAADFIRANNLPHPLFNTYEWGGFLIWYLPEYPVSSDGRLSLYGGELMSRYFDVIGGGQRLEAEPSFANAGTVLLEKNSGIANALTTIPSLISRYRVAYSDDVALVIVPYEKR